MSAMKNLAHSIRVLPTLALLAALMLAVSCSGTGSGSGGSSEEETTEQAGATEGTRTAPDEETASTSPDRDTTAGSSAPPEDTSGEPRQAEVVLRLDGDPGTTFSGVCTVGGEEYTLSGEVPERYTYAPGEQGISCRVQKQGEGGTLEVSLLAGDSVRSVQTLSGGSSSVEISYSGGGIQVESRSSSASKQPSDE